MSQKGRQYLHPKAKQPRREVAEKTQVGPLPMPAPGGSESPRPLGVARGCCSQLRGPIMSERAQQSREHTSIPVVSYDAPPKSPLRRSPTDKARLTGQKQTSWPETHTSRQLPPFHPLPPCLPRSDGLPEAQPGARGLVFWSPFLSTSFVVFHSQVNKGRPWRYCGLRIRHSEACHNKASHAGRSPAHVSFCLCTPSPPP